jgi:hypothetical protein
MTVTEIEFLLAPGQNAFFAELAAILRDELLELGRPATITIGAGEAPPADRVQVLIPPHEYVALSHAGLDRSRLERMIFVCAEPPASAWFDGNVTLAPRAGAVFDINRATVEEFNSLGIAAHHLPLGYSRSWDRFDAGAERDVDVTFMGCATDRRERILSGYAPILARRRCELVISDNDAPNPGSGSSFLAGDDKWSLLGRSKLLLNVHREDFPPYFEWVRVLEAIHCGAVVVSERSSHFAPLEAGTHFISGHADSLALLVDELLYSPERLERIRGDAYGFVREQLPLRDSAAMLAEAADRIAARPIRRRPRFALRRARLTARGPEPSLREVLAPVIEGRQKKVEAVARIVKQNRLETIALGRRLAELEHTVAGEATTEPVVRHQSTGFGESAPRVSVIVPAYNQSELLAHALDSVAASEYPDLELVVVDDCSTDLTGDVAERWMRAHPELPALLLRHPVNRGLPATRNTAIGRSTGELVLPLDSDNELFPTCLSRLTEALDRDPAAAFAYGILQGIGDDGPERVMGYYGWEPERLAHDNYIDALALIRREALEQVGGYCDEAAIHGWEDYDLWCTFAERGLHGAHVREFVARYRIGSASMIQLTGISIGEAKARLTERHPRLFAEVDA